jgi:hypothetical protein
MQAEVSEIDIPSRLLAVQLLIFGRPVRIELHGWEVDPPPRMDEAAWLGCTNPDRMLAHLAGQCSGRKLRLFACTCCRRRKALMKNTLLRQLVLGAEQFADGLLTATNLYALTDQVWPKLGLRPRTSASAVGSTLSDALAVAREDPLEAAGRVIRATVPHQAALLRHIIGNPFRPYPAAPHWPASVIELAKVLYDQQPVHFALHDALLDAGYPDLAAHFKESEHPKGCWAVDVILGRE